MKKQSSAIGLSTTRFLILDSQGKETALSDDNLEAVQNQLDPALVRVVMVTVVPKESIHFANHMETMQRLEWVDYEPASDKGHFRFYPNGALIYKLLTSWCEQIATEIFEALPLKTPFIYLLNNQAVRGQIGIFSKSVYPVFGGQGQNEFVLRFNDDLGLFEVMKDSQITHRHLPVRIYEHTPSFRYHQSGSLSGIRRGRYFSFTDIHSFCLDLERGLAEYQKVHRLLTEITSQVGINIIIHFKVAQSFYPVVKRMMTSMLTDQEKMLIEIIPGQRQYWIMKYIACTDHPQKLFHVQLDLENSERFDIKYVARDGSRKNCVIVHTSLGSIERWMIITIEDALKKSPPVLPLWLSPTQVRVIPVSEKRHLDFCLKIARELKQCRVRI
ncbi:hypothetical protein ISS21_02210, partial [Patescibacteria group bacterium]|nr:hypothetical protein [Patescibacteria group bacterium]